MAAEELMGPQEVPARSIWPPSSSGSLVSGYEASFLGMSPSSRLRSVNSHLPVLAPAAFQLAAM